MKSVSVKLKTPLRYPGGKSRATVKMSQYLPDMDTITSYREPFLGGGSMALYMTQRYPHLKVWVNDAYAPLVTFWQVLRDDGEELQAHLLDLKGRYPTPDRARVLFAEAKEYLNSSSWTSERKITPFDRAVSFYILNKCSFSGLTESSSFSNQASQSNFSVRGIEKLSEYSQLIKDWTITDYDYTKLMTDTPDTLVYLDPPYDIKDNLYGKKGNMHKGFDHDGFANSCNSFNSPMMLSYNSSNPILERFRDWNAVEYDHTYTMRSVGNYMKDQQERKELLLFNYELP